MNHRFQWRHVLIGVIILAAAGAAVWTAVEPKSDQTASGSEQAVSRSEETEGQGGDHSESKTHGAIREGSPAPDFTLKTLQGEKVSLSDNGGKPTIINFWASWCGPCREEMPLLQKAYEQYGDQVNFRLINTGDGKITMDDYLKKQDFTFPILRDESGEVADDYQIINIPQTFIVDEQGQVIKRVMGTLSEEELMNIMKKITS
ncbi:MAG: TlpA disulfide reductase family protein [Firmicutes bacterium]|uniref:Thiol-disulfide isomerase or thioredoxin n=1 Tax=Melghirimyces thermohalophilus TaxID=1236220 RepID=A0A1G6HPY9_9BACL|nr:TlpA disulfide reductase family protein [Melghirimyces thermohalophilus]MDA8353906.1 TlpA disulfide reductase family protein [Bacillota bacterium]SDB96302.1 Thiol-disulfide isomerase or thioredoxin [Melghirimyces thermohalophilus]